MIDVTIATEQDAADWEEFLACSPKRHHALSWSWSKVLPEVFHHKAYMLIAREAGAVVGICPLYHVKSLLFGGSLISVPYLNSGGVITERADVSQAIVSRADELGKQLRTRYIEYRSAGADPHLEGRIPAAEKRRVTMVLPLSRDPEQLFSSFTPKLRSQIRRPSKAGYFAQVSGIHISEDESVKAFYRVFSEHMRDLGTPSYPRELYGKVQKQFGSRCRIVTVWKENEPVAAGLTIGSPKVERRNAENGSSPTSIPTTAEIPWASSLRRFHKDSPNMLLYWEAIKTACADGYDAYDFGRSAPDSGTFRFKQQWGAEPSELRWYYQIFSGSLPDVSPNNPKYELMVRCWKKLPLGVANTLGSWISRSIP